MTWVQHCAQMSQTVLDSSDTLNSWFSTSWLTSNGLIICSAMWNLADWILTWGVFICCWAVGCYAPLLSFKVIFAFVFPNCMLFISYQSLHGAPLCCSQQVTPLTWSLERIIVTPNYLSRSCLVSGFTPSCFLMSSTSCSTEKTSYHINKVK